MFETILNTARLIRAPEGESGGGGTDPGAGGGTQPAPGTPPWGADVNKMWMVGEGPNAKPWFETVLPDGPTKELYRAKQYANPVVGADAHYSAHRMVNGNVVEIPKDDAKPEAWEEFHKKLGRPEAADKYEFKMPEGVKPDETLVGFGKTLAFKLGLSPSKAQAMVDAWNEYAGQANAATVAETQKENETELNGVKTKWGDKWDANTAAGKRVAQSLFDLTKPEENAIFQKINGAIGDAAMLDLFARIGSKSGEGGMIGGGSTPSDNIEGMTVDQATTEVNRMRADPAISKALGDPQDPNHAKETDKLVRLYARGVKI